MATEDYYVQAYEDRAMGSEDPGRLGSPGGLTWGRLQISGIFRAPIMAIYLYNIYI